MIADLNPYAEYKASDQAWIGMIPAHWSVLPNRAIFSEVKDRNHPDEEMLSVTITKGIIRQKALLAGSSKKDSSNLNKSAYKLVCPQDIAYNKMRAWQGAIGVSDYRGIVSPAYVVIRLREDHNPRYFHHLYRTPYFAKEAERWSYGITSDMWSLRPEHFKMIYTPLPSADEQTAIVRFLDHTKRRIDRFIRAKKKVIALLNERKQAIIHSAITKGLDPNVPMKDSEIPWLGDIPKDWKLMKLKHISPQITVGIVVQPARLYVSKGVPCLRSLNISSGRISTDDLVFINQESHRTNSKSEINKGDVVIVRTGRTGVAVVVSEAFHGANCIDLLIVRKSPRLLSEYLVMYFNSHGAKSDIAFNSVGAIQAHYNTSTLSNLRIPLPTIPEQEAILQFLETELAPTDTAISRTEREIALLREFRTRLIADVVTGKLDVREAAKKLPEEAEQETLPEGFDEIEVESAEENGETEE
jgi:type I restriction enzyme, S subunit